MKQNVQSSKGCTTQRSKRAEFPEEGEQEDKDSKHRKDTIDTDRPFLCILGKPSLENSCRIGENVCELCI